MCPICASLRIGDTEVKATIKTEMGDKVKKNIFACLSCGVMFVEADMNPEQLKLKREYETLNPFK